MASSEHISLLNSCGSSQQITRTEKDGEIAGTPRVEALFHLSDHTLKKYKKYWQVQSTHAADFAIGIDQFPQARVKHANHWIPGDKNILTDFNTFPERNTGAVLWSFERRVAHTFAHFIPLVPLVSEHIYKVVATQKVKVINDQTPFRVATYLFRRLEPDFVEHQIPMHASCRTYAGKADAGTDGFLNGMYPLQQDGKHCSECSCTACLINHCSSAHFVTVKGYKGWELDIPANVSLSK
eukprot:scaffold34604_cov88-Skeletonema_dohrnii-CCMP3373.AAC.2